MTVNSNSSVYSSYSSSGVSSSSQRVKPDFEKMAQELLTSMDTDSNGSIDKTEFSTAVQALDSSSSSSKSATDIFNTLDANSDGKMSSEELMAALKNTKPPEPPQGGGQHHDGGMPPPPPPSDSSSGSSGSSSSSSSLSKIFSSLDTNKDGTISADELMALFDDSKSKSGDTTSSSATSASQTDTSTNQLSKNLLKQILASYGNNNSTSATSQLSLSA